MAFEDMSYTAISMSPIHWAETYDKQESTKIAEAAQSPVETAEERTKRLWGDLISTGPVTQSSLDGHAHSAGGEQPGVNKA